ncbi:MAG: hypothetical protein ABL933_11940 [Methyloglobulus sp.]
MNRSFGFYSGGRLQQPGYQSLDVRFTYGSNLGFAVQDFHWFDGVSGYSIVNNRRLYLGEKTPSSNSEPEQNDLAITLANFSKVQERRSF